METIDPDELAVEVGPLGDADPDYVGALYVELDPGGRLTWYGASFRDDTPLRGLPNFRDWAARALNQLEATRDPAGNGFSPSKAHPGTWYMTCRAVELPPL